MTILAATCLDIFFYSSLLVITLKVFLLFVRRPTSTTRESDKMANNEQTGTNLEQKDFENISNGPMRTPIFGNLKDLGTLPHRNLLKLTEKFGNIYHLKLGKWKALAVNGLESCKNVLLKNGKFTSSRPDFESFKYYSHGRSLSFQPFNDVWLTQRKATSRTIAKLITTGPALNIAYRQMNDLVAKWSSRSSGLETFEASSDIVETVGGFIYSLCYGENEFLNGNSEYKKILLDPNPGTDMFAAGNNIDLLPHVFKLFSLRKHQEHIDRMNHFLDLHNKMREKVKNRFVQNSRHPHDGRKIDESTNLISPGAEYTCVMEAMFVEVAKMLEKRTGDCFSGQIPDLHEDHFLNLPAEFLSAGTETSTAVLLWLLRYVALTPGVQENVYKELKEYVMKKAGGSHFVEYTDRPYLPYTESCLMESLRCMAVVPFALPHFTSDGFQFDGISINKETLILPNLWSAGRDPTVWTEPEKFVPERHLTNLKAKNSADESYSSEYDRNNEVMSQSKEQEPTNVRTSCPFIVASSKSENFFPFGLGKRRCVGEALGRMLNFILFSNIMLNFQINVVPYKNNIKPPKTSKCINNNNNNNNNNNLLEILYSLLRRIKIHLNILNIFLIELLTFAFPSLKSEEKSADLCGNEELVESYGDVMRPKPYDMFLTRRQL